MESINSINDSCFNNNMSWNSYEQPLPYSPNIPPPIYNSNGMHNSVGNNDQFMAIDFNNDNYNQSMTPYYNDNQETRVIANDHLLPSIPHNINYNNYSNNNNINNGYYNNNNNITMPPINLKSSPQIYESNDTYSTTSSSHSPPSNYSPKQSPNNNTNITVPAMENMMRMNEMMKEMKQNMTEMMMITNINCMNNMNHMLNKCNNSNNKLINHKEINNFDARSIREKQSNQIDLNIPLIAPKPLPLNNNNKKRTLTELNDELICDGKSSDSVHAEYYPEIGLRFTTTVKVSKKLFIGYNKYHFKLSNEILFKAIKRITEYRWIHNKYNININDIKYVLFLSENINNLPNEFKANKPKRGRPPKHKKQKLNLNAQNISMKEYNLNVKNDKIYRLNFQIIFKYNILQNIRSEIIKCIKIDLNKNSFTQLLTNVINENVIVNAKILSYSLYAVDSQKLVEYEKYAKEEDLRKKKKREREQKRRENKKKVVKKDQ